MERHWYWVNGLLGQTGIKYQLYLVNGLLGYRNNEPLFSESNTYRGGRQKGSKTIMSGLPVISGQIEYFGFPKTKIGLSYYSGKSNSDAYNGLLRNDKLSTKAADSTTVRSNILALHFIKYFTKSTGWRDFHRSKIDQKYFINSGIGVWF